MLGLSSRTKVPAITRPSLKGGLYRADGRRQLATCVESKIGLLIGGLIQVAFDVLKLDAIEFLNDFF